VKVSRRTLIRWHVWLGWLIGVPLVLWTVSGLIMVARPIEEVRGTDLRAELPPLPAVAAVVPKVPPRSLASLSLRQTALGPRWIAIGTDERRFAADPRNGLPLPSLDRAQAEAAARAYRSSPGRVASVRFTPADRPPLDLRQPRPAWAVDFSDRARFYIDAETGELLAVRTGFWRFYDVMWGLHIMDLPTREDTHNPLIIILGALAAVGSVLGVVVLVLRYVRPRRLAEA
jgi:uncharacterized iron-regulated membrane protein